MEIRVYFYTTLTPFTFLIFCIIISSIFFFTTIYSLGSSKNSKSTTTACFMLKLASATILTKASEIPRIFEYFILIIPHGKEITITASKLGYETENNSYKRKKI